MFTGYGQVLVRNGGRNGVVLTAGFRWRLGKDNKSQQNVKDNNRNTLSAKKVVKQL